MIELLAGVLSAALLAGGVLVLAAFGEVLAERIGVFNLGLEGIMALDGIPAIIAVAHHPSARLGLLAAVCAGLLAGAVFASAIVLVRANQTLCQLSPTIAGLGLAAAVGRSYSGQPAGVTFAGVPIPRVAELPIRGRAVFSQNFLMHVIWIVLRAALHWPLYKTRHGINLRAVGQNPSAADAGGVPVTVLGFGYVVASAGFAGAAGAYLAPAFVSSWSDEITGGRGWIAMAFVIFAGFRPYGVVLGALLPRSPTAARVRAGA